MLQHFDVSLHQHSSTHAALTISSCPVTPCQTPSQGGRCTCTVSTAPHSHLLQGFSITAISYKSFPPQEGALHPAVALECSCYRECGSLVSACSTFISFTSLYSSHPMLLLQTLPMAPLQHQSSATHRDPVLWKAKATHP